MLEKMNLHYAFNNPATVHDEEALTALELAGRQGAKINELVTAYNTLEADTSDRLEAQDNDIKNQKETVIPTTIRNEVQNQIDNGTFDEAIDEYAGNLEARLDSLIGKVVDGTSTRDSEILDARIGYDNTEYANLGASIRSQIKGVDLVKKQATYTKEDGVVTFDDEFNDFNNPIENSYVTYIDHIGNVLNAPPNHSGSTVRVGSLLTISNRAGKDVGIGGASIQFFFEREGATYYRFYWSGWGTWVRLDSFNSIMLVKNADGGYNEPFNNLDTLPTNSYIVYAFVENVENLPVNLAGAVLTFGKVLANNASWNGSLQLYITYNEEIYVRLYWSNRWLGWNKIAQASDITTISEKVDALSTIPNYEEASVAMFEHIGVVGDSYASGHLYDNSNNSLGEFVSVSWNQILARRNGVSVETFAKGGATTQSWLTIENGLPKLLSTEAQQLYILCLGLNDRNKGDSFLGSIADIKDDHTQNADTFYGNYGKIIANIKNHAPNAKIIISAMAKNDTEAYQSYNAAIEEIAQHFGIPCIKQYEEAFFKSSAYLNMNGSHPTAVAHSGMASAMERLIAKCLINNKEYFGEYTGE